MTIASEECDQLITTTVQAMTRIQAAWTQALSDVWLVVQDTLPVEDNVLASNQTEADIPALPNDTTLVISVLTGSGNPPSTIAPDRVTISPSTVAAGTPTTVVVSVVPLAGTPPGTYQGTVDSAAGAALAPVFVTVTASA
jgi:hypothetical protein